MKRLSVVTAVLVALLAGCGPQWTVVKRPTPSPVAAAKTFAVKPLDFSRVSIDGTPEAAWRAAQSEAKNRWWDEDKAVASRHYMQLITESTKSGRTFTEAGTAADAPVVVLEVGDMADAVTEYIAKR